MMKRVLGLWMTTISSMILVLILLRGMEVMGETGLQLIILRYERCLSISISESSFCLVICNAFGY